MGKSLNTAWNWIVGRVAVAAVGRELGQRHERLRRRRVQQVFEKFIRTPADGGRRHLVEDASLQPSKVGERSAQSIDRFYCFDQTRYSYLNDEHTQQNEKALFGNMTTHETTKA